MADNLVWPDPVPCRPENPVQGIRQCEALRTGTNCRWLGIRYCGVRVDDMQEALEVLGLDNFSWLLEEDATAEDIQEAESELRGELLALRAENAKEEKALASVRWFV